MARPRSFDRDEVLDEVRDLFWERGYAATSLTDLERVSGLNRASLYNAFGNKEALYALILERYRARGQMLKDRLVAAADNPLEGARALLRTAIEDALADAQRKGCLINNATNERAALCARTAGFVADNRESFISEFTAHLRRAETEGRTFAQPAEDLAIYLFALYSGLMSLIRTGAEPEAVRRALRTGLAVVKD